MKKSAKKTSRPSRAAPKKSPSKTKNRVAASKTKTVAPAKKVAVRRDAVAPRRADYGAPIDGFFAKQPEPQRAILQELRRLVSEAAPNATATLKWGMPFYTLGGKPVCALAGFKSHVNLILAGPPGTFDDPDGLLDGDGKTGKHLKVKALAELPRPAVRRWLKSAVKLAGPKSARA